MATIAQGVLGPMAGWLMLLFIMVTLYDAQFPIYDTFIGRTTCDAIAVTGRARRPYRFYYFVVVTAAVAAGFYLITVAQPFILWIGVAISALVYRSIGAWQILLLNNRRLPDGFKVSTLNTWLLWITVVTGLGGVGYLGGHGAAGRDRQAVRRIGAFLPGGPDPGPPGRTIPMLAYLWALLMLVWLGALLFGLWWVWPHFERMQLTGELVAALFWLIMGALAWILALRLGIARYWPRRR